MSKEKTLRTLEEMYRFFYKWINGKLGVKIWIIRKKSSHC